MAHIILMAFIKVLLTLICLMAAYSATAQQTGWTNVIHGDTLYLKNLTTLDSFKFIMPQQLKMSLTDSVGFGTKADAKLTVSNVVCLTCPAPQTGTLIHSINENTTSGRFAMDSYNSNPLIAPIIQGRAAGGVANSPTIALKDRVLFVASADGYGPSGFHNASLAGLSIRAAQDFTSQTSAPTYLVLSTSDSGTTVAAQQAILNHKGMWQWNGYKSVGYLQTDINGNVTTGALPAGTDTTSLSNRINTKQATISSGTGISIASNTVTNTAPDQTVSLTGANNFTSTGTYPNFTLTQYIPTVTNAVTRPINSTTFTVSTTKQAYVTYNVTISCTATIGSAATGSIALQYSTNGGGVWNTVGTVSNSNTVTLAIVLNSVQASGLQVSGYIPANALVRMVPATVGTRVITYLTGQETY